MDERPSGTVSFLFTDVEGSTALLMALGDRYPAILLRQRALVTAAAARQGGSAFGTEGDAVFLAFHDPSAALRAAADAQRALAAEPWPEGHPVRVRMGVHVGEAARLADDYVGLALHETARVAAAGHGGQVLVSAAGAALARAGLSPGLSLRDLGDHRLKDLTGPRRLYQLLGDGLPDRFPVLRSLEGRPHNLPAQLTSFVGRADLSRGVELVRRSRLLTLTGPGGTGKTRLALQVAAEVLDDHPDGTWFVALETTTDPEQVPAEILAVLAVPTSGHQTPLDRLLEHLAPRTMLLILDNLEQVVDVGPTVARLLRASPGLRVVATSRIALRVSGEQELPVPPLALPADDDPGASEAVRLFVDRAMAVRPGFTLTPATASAVVSIVRRLDGLPLAIELAAARTRTLSTEAILARLDRSLGLLTGGARDLPTRQQTLRGAIDWSHDLLSEPERRLFARLSVFAGGIDPSLVEAVVGDAVELGVDPLDGLDSLADKSLLRAGAESVPRFTMLVTIREYAMERLVALGDQDAIAGRHQATFLELAERAAPELTGPEAGTWLDRLSLEHDNLRAALDRALAQGDLVCTLRLATALWRFWQIRRFLVEAQRRYEAILAVPAAWEVPADVLSRALVGAGSIAYWRGDASGMRRWYPAALEAAERCGDPVVIAEAAYNAGFTPTTDVLDYRQFALGRVHFERALAIWRELGDRSGIAKALWALGLGGIYGDAYGPARRYSEEALELARESGNRFYESWAVWDLALLDLIEQDPTSARERLRIAGALFAETRDTSGPVLVLQGLALVARAMGDEAGHWRLRGATERRRVATGVDLVRQRMDALGWDYDQRPPDAAMQAHHDAGQRLSDEEVDALIRGDA